MYLCICCNITESDVEKDPTLKNYIGSVCGACIPDGPDIGFDGAYEQFSDSADDHDTIE